jgi:predicted GNAT superfamily acetyltransferase
MEITIRHLETLPEYRAAVEMQKDTWGRDFADAVPLSILKVAQRVGGITAGAFTPDGRMVGCVFGLTGLHHGQPAHWSDILAVSPDMRGTGLGKRLKWFQRAELLKLGVKTMFWTFDPLQSLNANLNINTLGARPVEYVENMYGETGSDLHSGLGTDRFVAQWDLESPHVEALSQGRVEPATTVPANAPVVNTTLEKGVPVPHTDALPDVETVLVEIPASINETKRASRELGMRWRICTREAFVHYFAIGFRVDGFVRLGENRHAYVLVKGRSGRDVEC